MKILYSQIKQLVPGLKANPEKVAQALTMSGLMCDEFKEITYQGKKDQLIGLEIRQNRADCLSVVGIAREVAAYWGLDFQLPPITSVIPIKYNQDIRVKAPQEIKRILAIQIDNLKNGHSPKWLQDFLNLYDINSVNLLVDLSNYVMLVTGYPSHLLDKNKISGNLVWDLNKKFETITTLDETRVSLKKKEIVIHDNKNILALAGIVGGSKAKIDHKTTSIIAEIAIYNRVLIRKNSRSLHISTEASSRLEKGLDPNGVGYALSLLISLIEKYSQGKAKTTAFSFYPKKHKPQKIFLDPQLPSIYSGIEIPKNKVLKIFSDLRFNVQSKGNLLEITPPTDRMDINIPEDLIEEVVRINGFEKIPMGETPRLDVVRNITSPLIRIKERIRDFWADLGFNEILSLTLVNRDANKKYNYLKWDPVQTQNSVNEEYPDLRQSIAPGLISQARKYQKKNVKQITIFEIGKIFGKNNSKFEEHDSLGILVIGKGENILDSLFIKFSQLLGTMGLENLKHRKSKTIPEQANPFACYDILTGKQLLGIIYKLKPNQTITESTCFAEVDLEIIARKLENINLKSTVELTRKLVILDANVILSKNDSIFDYLDSLKKKVPPKNIWSIYVTDSFSEKGKIKYTIRATYKELSDQKAKKIHLKAFGLKK